jgi:hypothetical protein
MISMIDSTFGELSFDFGWRGTCEIDLFSQTHQLMLFISCDEDDPIEAAQRAAYHGFHHNQSLLRRIEQTVRDHYQRTRAELKAELDSNGFTQRFPDSGHVDPVSAHLKPTEIVVPRSFDSGERIIAVLFDCSWDPGHGVGVKVVNESDLTVGPQDLVL